jgi:sigma-B regulation protein RsbU (phosphoserine phosphatase)
MAIPFYHDAFNLSYTRQARIKLVRMLATPIGSILLQVGTFSPDRWRWALFVLSLTVVLATIGLTALSVFLLQRRARNLTLLYFSVFVLLYAVRMLVREGPLVSAFQIPQPLASHAERLITFSIVIPALLVFLQDVDPRRRVLFRVTLFVQVAFALLAIPADFLHIAPQALDTANSILVLVFWAILVVFLFFLRPPGRLPTDLRVVAVGLSIFAAFVLHANLVGLRIIPGQNLEPIGFLVFVWTLGYLVAHRIAAQEQSLRAIEKELEIARQIQTSILPREVPRLAELDVAARYLPMSAVAGDFYDFLLLDDKRVGILIADVTGHGVPAALIASMLKVAFAGQTAHAEDPARVLASVNQALCGKFDDHFVTAAYVFLDLDAKLLRYAGAGHPPVLFVNRAQGAARSIEQNGLFLGMFPEAEYTSLEVPLRSGDRYLLYTDGLAEAKNVSEQEFSQEGLKRFLETHSHLGTAEISYELLKEIAQWSLRPAGQNQEDDMTLLVLDYQVHA